LNTVVRTDITEHCINAFPAQIMTNFGSSKSDLNLKYRLGLEHALAKANFLNAPDIVLVQALAIFLGLARRHDSPRFVWMMTGLVIRMAQYLGLQRDGSHFEHLTPFEVEMRRKVWWAVCLLDLRTSEDQGTDLTMTRDSFDTKIPLNINDADINPESKQTPTERDGVTDMSFARINIGLYDTTRQLMALDVRDGVAGLEDQSRLLNEIYQKYEDGYFRYATESGNILYWVGVSIARLVIAKMTLIVFLPVLFSSPSEHLSGEIRTKLLVSAIEVAEYNHALNSEQACRQWRWIFQTYTHWHAIVYLMIEISRRPWSPIVERAWVALHSSWLIPAQTSMDKNLRIWVPLRKLMANARRHRDTELNRLRADPEAAARLDVEDQKIPLPSSSGSLSTGSSVDVFRERWRQLVDFPQGPGDRTQTSGTWSTGIVDPSMHTTYPSQPAVSATPAYTPGDLSSNVTFEPTYLATSGHQTGQAPNTRDLQPTNAPAIGQNAGLPYNPFPADWSDGRSMGPGFVPWFNVDIDFNDVNMHSDEEMDWYNWVESAKGMEWDAMTGGNGRI
jgi:hypothetical protein